MLAEEIQIPGCTVVIALGNGAFPSTGLSRYPSPTKGIRKVVYRRNATLQNKRKIVNIDEYYTSRRCNKCHDGLDSVVQKDDETCTYYIETESRGVCAL